MRNVQACTIQTPNIAGFGLHQRWKVGRDEIQLPAHLGHDVEHLSGYFPWQPLIVSGGLGRRVIAKRTYTPRFFRQSLPKVFCPNLTINSALHNWGGRSTTTGVLVCAVHPCDFLCRVSHRPTLSASSITFCVRDCRSTEFAPDADDRQHRKHAARHRLVVLHSAWAPASPTHSVCPDAWTPPRALPVSNPGASCHPDTQCHSSRLGNGIGHACSSRTARPGAPHQVPVSINGSSAPPPHLLGYGHESGPRQPRLHSPCRTLFPGSPALTSSRPSMRPRIFHRSRAAQPAPVKRDPPRKSTRARRRACNSGSTALMAARPTCGSNFGGAGGSGLDRPSAAASRAGSA